MESNLACSSTLFDSCVVELNRSHKWKRPGGHGIVEASRINEWGVRIRAWWQRSLSTLLEEGCGGGKERSHCKGSGKHFKRHDE
jgi:hypothetical protein